MSYDCTVVLLSLVLCCTYYNYYRYWLTPSDARAHTHTAPHRGWAGQGARGGAGCGRGNPTRSCDLNCHKAAVAHASRRRQRDGWWEDDVGDPSSGDENLMVADGSSSNDLAYDVVCTV